MLRKPKALGATTVTTAGTRVQLTTSEIRVDGCTITADPANTGRVYIGDELVSSSRWIKSLLPGESCNVEMPSLRGTIEEFILSDLWLDAATSGNSVQTGYGVKRD